MSEGVPNPHDLSRPRGTYGVDGDYRLIPPAAVAVLAAVACLTPAALAVRWLLVGATVAGVLAGVLSLILVAIVASILHYSRELLPSGQAVGVDVWRPDQTGNSESATLRNAELEGVADRVELLTRDMTDLALDDGSFDLIVSSLAIHNLPGMGQRLATVDEAVRVLRPGGRIALADVAFTRAYALGSVSSVWST